MEDYWCPTFLLPFVFAVTSLQLLGRLTYRGRWQWLEKSSGIVSPSVVSSEKVEGERSRRVSKPDVTPNVWCVAANICANLSLLSLFSFSHSFECDAYCKTGFTQFTCGDKKLQHSYNNTECVSMQTADCFQIQCFTLAQLLFYVLMRQLLLNAAERGLVWSFSVHWLI